jgi:hypothetical protein
MEIEVDVPVEDVTIIWTVCKVPQGESGRGQRFSFEILPKHVSKELLIQVHVTSKKEWHRHGTYDASLLVAYKVLPPFHVT